MRSLLIAITLAVFTAQANAVTYQATGMFDDGTTWTAQAIFQETAMADMVVTISEMDSFLATTQASLSLLAATYDATESPGVKGLRFDGTSAGANVIGPPNLLGGSNDDDMYVGVDLVTGQLFSIFLNGSDVVLEGGDTDNRVDRSGVAWSFIPDNNIIPEPLTAALIPLAMSPLLMRRRRAA